MCGIAGLLGKFDESKRSTALEKISRKLQHRGIDGEGRYDDGEVALFHSRLSIIDVSERGNQPFFSEDKSTVLVCNGEIYNYKALRQDLSQKGHKFHSESDSEVVLHLYEEHRDNIGKMLNMLTGMFAFAIWDGNRRRLVVARDRVGIKPLYYSVDKGNLLFSSEVNTMVGTGLLEHTTDITSLYEYFLLSSIPGPNTIYNEVKCLEAGHYMIAEQGRVTTHQYWDVPQVYRQWKSEEEVTEATDALLTTLIKEHLVADVPVGSFLSAGVDSSLITAIAADHHKGIYTFTASFPGAKEDEAPIARATAKKLGTSHHEYALTEQNFFSEYLAQFSHMDQPFAISSALSLGYVCKLARQHVKVVLSGDGGDELFGGYGRHEMPKTPGFLNYIPAGMQNSVLKLGKTLTGKQSLERLRQYINLTDGRKFLDRIQFSDPATALTLIHPALQRNVDTERFRRRVDSFFDKRSGDPDALNKILYADVKTTLVDEMLTKCDRMTLLNGIEGRVPFLDHRMVELAFSIPGSFKRKDGNGKVVLRQMLAKRLGKELAYREKTGFNNPLYKWMTNDNGTRSFAQSQLAAVADISVLNQKVIKPIVADPSSFHVNSVFPLVCLGVQYEDNTVKMQAG